MTPPTVLKRVEVDLSPIEGASYPGIIIVEAVVTDKGRVRDVRVLQVPGNPYCERAAETLKQWQFEPTMRNGKPVESLFNLTVNINFRRAPN